jgi:hypothetical protein
VLPWSAARGRVQRHLLGSCPADWRARPPAPPPPPPPRNPLHCGRLLVPLLPPLPKPCAPITTPHRLSAPLNPCLAHPPPRSWHLPCSYSLFLAVFTFNAVVLCQYIGCCDVAGDPKVFAGKVGSRGRRGQGPGAVAMCNLECAACVLPWAGGGCGRVGGRTNGGPCLGAQGVGGWGGRGRGRGGGLGVPFKSAMQAGMQ